MSIEGRDRRRTARAGSVAKLETGIPGFDLITYGGLPVARATLVAGTAGSAKTVLATHFIAAGVARGEPGVFVTFEDSPDAIRANMRGFGWDIARWEHEGTWRFVDASADSDLQMAIIGDYDLAALLARIEHAVRSVGARRISLDSLNALFVQFREHGLLRSELRRISDALKRTGVTVVFTGERTDDYGDITRFGIEEFVADNVVILRNTLADEKRRRTIEILKMRGAGHERGEIPFTIVPEGITVIPLSAEELTQTSSSVRVTSGVAELDEMCGGGFFRDSITLVSGATGTGKTLLVTEFVSGAHARGERCLLFAFEESRDQLFRNAAAWGKDFAGMERAGLLRVVTQYPHAMPMEDHLVWMRKALDDFQPGRVAVDSLSALERVFTLRSFREFVISLTASLKQRRTTALFTSTTGSLLGGGSITEKHISTLTDSIILLRYVEIDATMRRSITVLKMRGSQHDRDIREYTIGGNGMHVLGPFRGVTGILSGHQVVISPSTDGADQDAGEEAEIESPARSTGDAS